VLAKFACSKRTKKGGIAGLKTFCRKGHELLPRRMEKFGHTCGYILGKEIASMED